MSGNVGGPQGRRGPRAHGGWGSGSEVVGTSVGFQRECFSCDQRGLINSACAFLAGRERGPGGGGVERWVSGRTEG